MPVYVYRVVREAGPDEVFELRQSIHDSPLTRHPTTGEPVERVILAPISGRVRWGMRRSRRPA